MGAPVKPVGLIVSAFRPSDDATTLQYLVPSNFFAVSSLRKAAEILTEVNKETSLAKECTDLAAEVEAALKKYATYNHPYFFKGKAGEGIGGPHIGYDMVWPMSIMMKAFTSQNDEEIKICIKMLMDTDAGTGFMHESFHKDDPTNFTRAWFAWQNTLFGELILKLVNEGKVDLLNSL